MRPQCKALTMKSVLVLGAGGFIGSHLTEALVDAKDFIVAGVDVTSEKLDEVKLESNFYSYDLTKDRNSIDNLIRDHDIVVNLIAIANPGIYVQDPLGTFRLDFLENLFVVESCVKYGKRLIQFSTSEVYGKSLSVFDPSVVDEFKEDESHFILGPVNKSRWIYACSKQLLERVIHGYGQQHDLDYTIVRPFNYIGPKIDFLPSHEEGIPRVFSFFMDSLLYNKTMYLVNGGNQKRCYTDIRDATAAHMLLLRQPERASKEIFNVGHRGNEVSIAQLAQKMRDIWSEQYGPVLPPLEEICGEEFYGPGYDDSDRRIPNSDKIASLGWKPIYSVDQCLRHSMNYYAERYIV